MKITGVGMYWAQIKGRFRGSKFSTAERRIFLAMKYGNLWKAKAQLKKFKHNFKQSEMPMNYLDLK
tara:strand:+ start:786 stop:983 length:198 start_codon:yes stop_codon:yes gene_type:complete